MHHDKGIFDLSFYVPEAIKFKAQSVPGGVSEVRFYYNFHYKGSKLLAKK